MEILKSVFKFVMDHDMAFIWSCIGIIFLFISVKCVLLIFRIEDMDSVINNYEEEISRLNGLVEANHDAWVAAKYENIKLEKENSYLKERISKKGELRSKDGKWCTESQLIAEEKMKDKVLNIQKEIASIDANEAANKQIDEYLQTDKK